MIAHLIKALCIVTALLAPATLVMLGQEAGAGTDTKSVQDGVYSAAQAERGEKVYEKACLECHPPEEFIGGYMDGWSGRTAHDLVEAIRETMPENNPGGLKRQEFIDIVAYLFKINGVPAGEDKMDGKTVKEIQIEGPFGKASEDSESKGAKLP
jgi:cytochrome c